MSDRLIAIIRNALMGLTIVVTLAGTASSAHAVANPAAIAWGNPSAAAFVTSLYVGVLGRSPESAAVVAGWASNISGDIRTRLRVFHGFINSAEYKRRFRDGTRGRYTLWANNCPKSPNNRYSVSTRLPRGSWSAQRNQVSINYGRALMGYYMVAFPYRRC